MAFLFKSLTCAYDLHQGRPADRAILITIVVSAEYGTGGDLTISYGTFLAWTENDYVQSRYSQPPMNDRPLVRCTRISGSHRHLAASRPGQSMAPCMIPSTVLPASRRYRVVVGLTGVITTKMTKHEKKAEHNQTGSNKQNNMYKILLFIAWSGLSHLLCMWLGKT